MAYDSEAEDVLYTYKMKTDDNQRRVTVKSDRGGSATTR